MKIIKKILASTLLLALLASCSSNDKNKSANSSNKSTENESLTSAEALDTTKTYKIGLDDTFAPMGFRDEDGELVGFDIDLAKDCAKRMGIEIEFTPIDWAMKETELENKNIDMLWNGYSITKEREEKVLFSTPYLSNKQIIITLSDSDLGNKDDLAGKTISLQENSSALEAVNKDTEFVDGLKEAPFEYATNVEAFLDVENEKSDAIVVDEVFGRYYIKTSSKEDKFKVLDGDFGTEEYAVGLRKEDTALKEALDKALKEQKEDGTYDKIYEKYFAK